jgi:aryl-alcohol dehydrogenase-like predicted oxidoreductase
VAVHEVKEHSLDRFRTQFAETRRLLGTRLALYQVHSLTPDSPLFGAGRDAAALRDALAGLAAEGVRAGFSTSGPDQADTVRRALDLEAGGRRLFTTVQSTWNVLEPSVAGALAEAHADGAHVLVKEALANGRLATGPPPALRRAAERHGTGPDAIALAAALAQPWADMVLSGAVSVAQLGGNLAATAITLDEGELHEMADLATSPPEYWERRAALPWT